MNTKIISLFSFCLILIGCKDLKSEGFVSDNNEKIEINTAKLRLFNLGKTLSDSNHIVIYLAGTNANGEPLTPNQLAEAAIQVTKNGEAVRIDFTDRTAIPFKSADSEMASQSIVLSYTPGWSEADLSMQRQIAREYAISLEDLAQFQVLSFSDHVLQPSPFTSDLDDTIEAMPQQNYPINNQSAHYDALGISIGSLAATTRTIKSSLIFICEPDTGSYIYTKDQVLTMTNTLKPFILAVGSEKADVEELKELAGPNGAVIYNYEIEESTEFVDYVAEALSDGVTIDLGPDSVGAESVIVSLPSGQTVQY